MYSASYNIVVYSIVFAIQSFTPLHTYCNFKTIKF